MRPHLILAVALLAASSAATASEDASKHATPRVQLVIAPYVWIPTITGNTALGALSVPVRVTPRDFAAGIKIGGMGNVRIERKRDFIFAEAIVADYDNKNFRPFFGQALASKIRYFELGAGLHRTWRIGPNTTVRLSPYAGVQFVHITSFVTGNLLTATANGSWTSPVIGVIAEVPVSRRLSLVGKLDGAGFGIGDTDYRSLAVLADLRVSKRLSFNAGYRWGKGRYASDTGLALDLKAQGPQIGLRYTVALAR
jgi:hypothetical protein